MIESDSQSLTLVHALRNATLKVFHFFETSTMDYRLTNSMERIFSVQEKCIRSQALTVTHLHPLRHLQQDFAKLDNLNKWKILVISICDL